MSSKSIGNQCVWKEELNDLEIESQAGGGPLRWRRYWWPDARRRRARPRRSARRAPQAPFPSTSAAAAAPTAPAVANGVEATITDVPWSKVGPGWILAMLEPHHPPSARRNAGPGRGGPRDGRHDAVPRRPDGQPLRDHHLPAGANSRLDLADWSGDGSHALFAEGYLEPATALSVDLHTGALTTIPVTGYPHYTRPDGKAILVSTDFHRKSRGDPETDRPGRQRADDVSDRGARRKRASSRAATSSRRTERSSCSGRPTSETNRAAQPTTAWW